jgi:type II secretory pathway pseudopilin PulG
MSHPPRLTRRRLLIGVIVVAIVAAMLPVITSFQKSRALAQRNSCVANMRQIDGATISLALETKRYRGATVPPQEVASFLKGGVIPTCPTGGTYTLPVVMQTPVCSVHGPLFSEAEVLSRPYGSKFVPERPKE